MAIGPWGRARIVPGEARRTRLYLLLEDRILWIRQSLPVQSSPGPWHGKMRLFFSSYGVKLDSRLHDCYDHSVKSTILVGFYVDLFLIWEKLYYSCLVEGIYLVSIQYE